MSLGVWQHATQWNSSPIPHGDTRMANGEKIHPGSAERTVPLRVTLREPPAGVTWALQIGRDELAPPAKTTRKSIIFDVVVRVAGTVSGGAPQCLGPAVPGPPTSRFLYLNSGLRAGQVSSGWDRRAKVPLVGISWALIEAVAAKRGAVLVAEVAGTARDGGPACASVPLLGSGWRIA